MPPAARITDMHLCPLVTGVVPHIGGPILPTGCPTVLIGMLPAARVGDKLLCVGPPDIIAKGSPTVLIGNMPAARLGDMTAHGGSIVLGFPTVIIGDARARGFSGANSKGGEERVLAKARRYKCRKGLIAKGVNSPDPVIKMAAERFQREVHDVEQAHLSADVYTPDDGPPPGWKNISNDNELLRKFGLEKDMLEKKGSSFRAQVYLPDPAVFGEDMKPTVAFKGTTMSSKEDWKNNAAQAIDSDSSYYRDAVAIGNAVSDSGAAIEVTGHSLGGGLASAASSAGGLNGTTYNAAGLNRGTIQKYNGTPKPAEINAYRVDGEILTGIQEQSLGATLIAAGAGLIAGGPITALLAVAAKCGVSAIAPNATGKRFNIPGKGIDPVSRHLMDQVLAGIESQKSEDQATLEAANGERCP